MRWYLTIQEFAPEFKYLPGRANVVADALSRNMTINAVIQTAPIANFILQNLSTEQRKHTIWGKFIYALESEDEVPLRFLHVPLKEFSLSKEKVLRRCTTQPGSVDRWVIPESMVPTILQLNHNHPTAGHPGRD